MKIQRFVSSANFVSWVDILLIIIDTVLWLATLMFTSSFGLCVSYFMSTTNDKKLGYLSLVLTKGRDYIVKVPSLLFVSIITFPSSVLSFAIWIVISKCFPKKDSLTYVSFQNEYKVERLTINKKFTFMTANMLLGPEFVGKFQNMPGVYRRLRGSARVLSMEESHTIVPNINVLESSDFTTKEKRDSVIIEHLPENIDFVCLQEVWDRMSALALIYKMRRHFPHFLTDVCQDLGNSSHIFRTSGLFLASRYPIMKTRVGFFDPVAHYQNAFAQAYLFAKLDIGILEETSGKTRQIVGYLANLHLPAYENETTASSRGAIRPLSRIHKEFEIFQKETLQTNEEIGFAVFSGDFNLCNISKCDSFEHNNAIFEEYKDICRIEGGVDHLWSVGTDTRQLSLLDPGWQSSESMREMLNDDIQRRYYILDGDIEDITPATPFILPKPNENGEVVADPELGGRRRVDRILYKPECIFGTPKAYHFSTALASLTDHVPVIMQFEMNKSNPEIN